ncbi:hypothetical protein GCK32_006937 [Trichostrongylus colubriformis]|uniref:Uncharacterized protein n=1 Tax=Trichostrongylus colubriformis TaxID=6319 RepID=A0AAN8FNU9_TRICO
MPDPSSVIVVVLLLLISLLLLNLFVVDYTGVATAIFSQRLEPDCDCKAGAHLISTSLPLVANLSQSSARGKTGAIPRLEWYYELMKRGTGKKGGPKMNISLLAAYEYPDQINVMITSRSKFGDVVYCRYFDKFRNEIGAPYKSVVFPEFNAHCILRNGTAFMSLTDTPAGEHEYPVPVVRRTQSGETN